MNNFSDLPLSIALQNNLAQLGFVQPTPVQALAIPKQLAGHDLVITAQTGTGKTFAFLLPMLERLVQEQLATPKPTGLRALILSPTRELAIRISQSFSQLATGTGLRAAVAVGGLNEQSQLHAIHRGAQVLIDSRTPGRFPGTPAGKAGRRIPGFGRSRSHAGYGISSHHQADSGCAAR
jgi:ATP-dependent RNA helicase RhlE